MSYAERKADRTEYSKALELLDEAIAINGNNATYWSNKGILLLGQQLLCGQVLHLELDRGGGGGSSRAGAPRAMPLKYQSDIIAS